MGDEQNKVANVLLFGGACIDEELNHEKPLSAVFAFDVLAGSNFQQRTVCFVSDYARQKIRQRCEARKGSAARERLLELLKGPASASSAQKRIPEG
jgi:hypothetical protein